MTNKNTIKISLCLNLLISILVLVAVIIMFTGFKFMSGNEIVLESTKLGVFKFFTVDSNIFIGLIATIFSYQEIKLLRGQINSISRKFYILKLLGTTAVTTTFVVVFCYLGPISKDGVLSLLMNSNLFLHLIIPIISIITFVFFEKTSDLSIKHTFCGIIPSLLYGMFYLTNIVMHMENGIVDSKYDWYWFVQNGVETAVIVFPLMLLLTYMIAFSLWLANRRTKK